NDPDLCDRRRFYAYQLDLAKKSEDLARYYEWAEGYSGIAMFFQRFLKPVEQLREFHLEEARLLRQRAGREPEPAAHVSRQDRSKHRAGLRALHAYIDLMDKFIRDWICKDSDLQAIAVLSEIAFP